MQLAGGGQPLQCQLFHSQQASRQLCSVVVQLVRHRALGTRALRATWLRPVCANVCLAVLASVQNVQPKGLCPLKRSAGTPAAAKRKVVGIKCNRNASSGRGGAWGRGRGGGGRGLGRLVSLSCDEDGDNSDNKGK
jgi:hypothetical protein